MKALLKMMFVSLLVIAFAAGCGGGGGGGGAAATYTISGTVSALSGTGLVLQNNGGDDKTITASGPFTFATGLATGATYSVTVKTQPANQTCVVSTGTGTVSSANVTDVVVACTTNDGVTTYTIGGTVSGLTGTLVLQNNSGDNKTISADGAFTFTTPVADGGNYHVTVKTQPTGQTCSVTNESGTVSGANVTNVAVTCTDNGGGSANYVPHTLGSRWTYSVTGGNTSSFTDQITASSANSFTRQSVNADGSYSIGQMALTGGVWGLTTSSNYSPSNALIDTFTMTPYYPLFPSSTNPGTHETYTYTITVTGVGAVTQTSDITVNGTESVTVPVGTFPNALKITSVMAVPGNTWTETDWYADGVGLVKSVDSDGETDVLIYYSIK